MVYITKPSDKPRRFLINRIRRVVPLYWFFTLLMAMVLFFLPSLFKTGAFNLSAVLQSLFFIPHYSIQNPNYVWPIVAPGWSLNYEMYFYLLFALSLFFMEKLRIPVLIAAITLAWAVSRQIDSDAALVRFLADPAVFEFIIGMLIAVAWKHGIRVPQSIAWAAIVAGFIMASTMPDTIHHWISITLPSVMIVVGFLNIKLPINRFGLLLGDASYAMYLSHIFVLGALRAVMRDNATESLGVYALVDNWLLRKERLTGFKQSNTEPSHL